MQETTTNMYMLDCWMLCVVVVNVNVQLVRE